MRAEETSISVNRSVERAIQVLEALAFEMPNGEGTLTALATQLGLPVPTVFRLLKTLERHRLVQKDESRKTYRLGSHLLTLGLQVSAAADLRREAVPIMSRLVEQTTEDCYLTVPDGYDGVFLEIVGGSQHLRIVERLGARVPLHCGATRKAILAFMPRAFIEEYVRRPLKRFTEHTTTDPQALLQQLRNISEQGYAVTYGEYIAESRGISAPVFRAGGQVVASIGVIFPALRADPERMPGLIRAVRKAADELSSRLGFRGHVPASWPGSTDSSGAECN